MKKRNQSRQQYWMVGVIGAILIIGLGFIVAWNQGHPFRFLSHYSASLLWEETKTMNDCAECHEAAAFHRCSTCHDDHGAVEFADLPFFQMIVVTGDVPDPGVVEVNQILPYRSQPHTHISLLDFLKQQGVVDFENVTLTSRDGGYITIQKDDLSGQALLLPFSDGIRFAAEDLHVSTWLKGLTGMIVVGTDRPLRINGKDTSIGRLLLGPTRRVTVDAAQVMYVSEQDGEVREAQTARWIEGAALVDLLPVDPISELYVVDERGEIHELLVDEVNQAVLIPSPSGVTLVLPELGRNRWVKSVVEIKSE